MPDVRTLWVSRDYRFRQWATVYFLRVRRVLLFQWDPSYPGSSMPSRIEWLGRMSGQDRQARAE